MSVVVNSPLVKKYKLLRGIHAQSEQTEDVCTVCGGEKKNENGFTCQECFGSGFLLETKIYEAGKSGKDIVPSEMNLEVVHGREKFQSVDSIQSTLGPSALLEELEQLRRENAKLKALVDTPDSDDLSSMTITQLRKYAEENDIELENATKKDEIIQIIRSELDIE